MWAFAIINSRLAEVYFEKNGDKTLVKGHCYVNGDDYRTQQEKKWIKTDAKKYRFTYRNKEYINQFTRQKVSTLPFSRE